MSVETNMMIAQKQMEHELEVFVAVGKAVIGNGGTLITFFDFFVFQYQIKHASTRVQVSKSIKVQVPSIQKNERRRFRRGTQGPGGGNLAEMRNQRRKVENILPVHNAENNAICTVLWTTFARVRKLAILLYIRSIYA
jgi:hypothetical protein